MKRTLLLTAAALLSQIAGANAAILLIIDVSNPGQVRFTATEALSSGTSSQTLGYEGITLKDLLKAGADIPNTNVVSNLVAISNLVPTQSPALAGGIATRYSGVATFNHDSGTGNFEPGNDLSMYQNGGGATPNSQVYTSGLRALSGESVWDLSAYASVLPNAGTTGDILSGYLPSGGGHGVVLGQYTVIPEPSSIALGALAASALVLRRRRL